MFEIHGTAFGDLLGNARGATGDGFPAGTPFTTITGRGSRAVTSWAFGDGAAFFDDVRRAFGAEHGLALPGITPLDGLMQSAGTSSTPARAVGGRLAGFLTSWLALEVAVDRGTMRSQLSNEAVAALEATRASYVSAFDALLTTVPQNSSGVTSTATASPEVSGNQTIVTGSLLLSIVRTSRVGIHAVLGGGIIQHDRTDFDATLASDYQFRALNTFPFSERETVAIRFSQKRQVPVGVAGLGVTLRVAGRTGIRLDARVLASENTSTTTVDASASRVTAAPSLVLPSLTTPSIQFSSAASTRTTLSGDPVSGLVTYRGSGIDLRPQFTIGYYVRF